MIRKERMFPVLDDPVIKALPWSLLEMHRSQIEHNHSQSLERLAERGGLGIEEVYVALRDEPLRSLAGGQEWLLRQSIMRMARTALEASK